MQVIVQLPTINQVRTAIVSLLHCQVLHWNNIYQSVTDNEQKINVLDTQTTANTNEITVLQNRINMLEEIIKKLVNIDVSSV